MTGVVSKNAYELLGNDPDEDSDKEPEPPTKVADKPTARTGKRNAPDAPHTARGGAVGGGGDRGGRGGRGESRGGFTGSEQAFRDRDAGSTTNRGKPADDGLRQDRHSDRLGGGRIQGAYDGRGGRGGAGGRGGRGNRDDRHSRSVHANSDKQAAHGWGATKGDAEWTDEKAGESIAKEEEKEGFDSTVDAPVDAEGNHPTNEDATSPSAEKSAAPAAEPEPEDNSKSYADYLAEQAEKKLQLGGSLEARKPNEGQKQDKKWAQAKELKKENDQPAYMAGAEAKAKREKERKQKNLLELDQRYVEPQQRGGREGGRGGRGRGEGRGDFRGGDRGRGGRGRGDRGDGFRGDRGDRGGRGSYRGARGGDSSVNVSDTSAFPSLGGPQKS